MEAKRAATRRGDAHRRTAPRSSRRGARSERCEGSGRESPFGGRRREGWSCEPGCFRCLLAEAPVVERRDDRLARPVAATTRFRGGCGATRAAVSVPGFLAGADRVNVEKGDSVARTFRSASAASSTRPLELLIETLAVLLRGSRARSSVLPVALEGGCELLDDIRIHDRRQPDIPFDAIHESGLGEVRGADERRRESALSVQEPCLRVETGALRLVGDPNLGAKPREFIERSAFGGPCVGRRDDA